MQKQTLYRNLAQYYDLIYSWKDYKKETAVVKRLIAKYKKSKGNALLEVGCGTGRYLQYLKDDFTVAGTDVNAGILRVARKKLKGVSFTQADMVTLQLGKEFDVIVCLFSSIGYVKTSSNLQKTLHRFAQHLKKGGVVIIEPWLTKSTYNVNAPSLTTYSDDNIKIARACVSKIRGDVSIMDMHYLVAERGKEVNHFVDRHELGLFEPKKVLAFMRDAGFQAQFLKAGLMKERGLYIGVKR